jgi:hypothetical protein
MKTLIITLSLLAFVLPSHGQMNMPEFKASNGKAILLDCAAVPHLMEPSFMFKLVV